MREVLQRKMPPKTDLDRLNDLIEWYEKNKPSSGMRIQTTHTPEKLGKMLGAKQRPDPKRPGELLPWPAEQPYRNRVILAQVKSRE